MNFYEFVHVYDHMHIDTTHYSLVRKLKLELFN